jgi:hypothetical protein
MSELINNQELRIKTLKEVIEVRGLLQYHDTAEA